MTSRKNEQGTSLVEIMVVMVLTGIVSAVVYSMLVSTVQIVEVTKNRTQAIDEARFVLEAAASNLRSARPLVGCINDSNGRCVRLVETSNQQDQVFSAQNNLEASALRQFTTENRGGVLISAQGDLIEAAIWPQDRQGAILAPQLIRIYTEDEADSTRLKVAVFDPLPTITASNAANEYRGGNLTEETEDRYPERVWDLTQPAYVQDAGAISTDVPIFRYILDSPFNGEQTLAPLPGERLPDNIAARVTAVTIAPEIEYRRNSRDEYMTTVVSTTVALRGDRFLREQGATGAEE